jgi:hypothetical protein
MLISKAISSKKMNLGPNCKHWTPVSRLFQMVTTHPTSFRILMIYLKCTEHVSVAVMLLTPILECSFLISIGRPAIFSDVLQSFQANARILPRLSHHRFLPTNFQLIILPSSYPSTLYALVRDSVGR